VRPGDQPVQVEHLATLVALRGRAESREVGGELAVLLHELAHTLLPEGSQPALLREGEPAGEGRPAPGIRRDDRVAFARGPGVVAHRRALSPRLRFTRVQLHELGHRRVRRPRP
jgi:hypothetical protein